MNQGKGSTFAPAVFLDTNAVHLAKLALTFSDAHSLNLFSINAEAFRHELKAKVAGSAMKSYVDGYWIARYLRLRASEAAQISYSPITGLELLCGNLRGEAIKRAANMGAPNRWFVRMDELQILYQLEPDGCELVQSEQQFIQQTFDKAGIVVNEQQVDVEVWQVARVLMENVFVDVQDSIIYASSFLLQASELITMDGHLRRISGYTYNPGSAKAGLTQRFLAVRKALVDWCVQVNGWDESQVVLPKPCTVADQGNRMS